MVCTDAEQLDTIHDIHPIIHLFQMIVLMEHIWKCSRLCETDLEFRDLSLLLFLRL